jgi:ketosteroid isomerase-like protein
MAQHPNFDRVEAIHEATRAGDYAPAFESFADDIIVENGPGAGPWHHVTNKDDFALLLLEFASQFGDTFHQDGRCIYADDRVAISLIRESGTAATSGDRFDNLAVYVSRLRPDGTSDRLTTVDLDYEHCVEFWERNPGTPSKDFS